MALGVSPVQEDARVLGGEPSDFGRDTKVEARWNKHFVRSHIANSAAS